MIPMSETDPYIRQVNYVIPVHDTVTSPKDTFISCVKNEEHGYLPMFLRDLTLGMDLTGVRTTDVFTKEYDHELSAASVKAFREFCGQDAVVGCIHSAAFNVEAFGGEMKYPEYGIPVPIKHPFENISEIPDIPLEPKGKALGAVRSYSSVRKIMPDVAVIANVEGPLTKAGTITGIDTLIMYMNDGNDILNEIISLCLDHTFAFLEALDKDGSMDCVFLASATDNPDMFGYDVYDDLVIGNLKKMVSCIHKTGYPVIFHPHGVFTTPQTADLFDRTIGTGIDGFQFAEDNDPRKVVAMTDGKCSVLGGTNVVPTLLNSNEKEIKSETRRYIEACKNTNHVFMCSCSLHRRAPLQSIKIMADTVHEYNRRIR